MRVITLKTKNLSEFAQTENPSDLAVADVDTLLMCGARNGRKHSYLCDIGDQAYILGIPGAVLIPKGSFSKSSPLPVSPHKLPHGYYHADRSHLLLNGKLQLIADSFTRMRVNPDLQPRADGNWDAILPDVTQTLDEPYFFVDWVCNHFGHAMVDTSAHLWALMERYGLDPDRLRFVGFNHWAVRARPGERPLWFRDLMQAYGIPEDRLLLLDRPTQFSHLVVAKRISPFITRSGPEYNAFMRRTGDRLLDSHAGGGGAGRKIFLSRSRLKPHGGKAAENSNFLRRKLGGDTETRLDELFDAHGYHIFHPQEMTLAEQVAVVRTASHIAGCVGSQMHLVAFCNQPELKILRVGPGYLCRSSTDMRIVSHAGPGYQLSNYAVDSQSVAGMLLQHSPWSMSEDDLGGLNRFLRQHLM